MDLENYKIAIFRCKKQQMKFKLFSLDELDFVQLICLPQGESFQLFFEKSKFLEGTVFSLFQHSFELSSPDYNFYSPFSFNISQCVTLRNHLVTNQARIAAISNADDLEKLALKQLSGIEFINALKDQNPDWKISWEKTRAKLLHVGEDLIEMIDYCIDEDAVLWIKGF
jgi:hypothetical protein